MAHHRDRGILRDVNGIHLRKNHIANKQQQNPIFGGKSLLRDLVVLQRSRTLRDPSERFNFVGGRHYSIALNGDDDGGGAAGSSYDNDGRRRGAAENRGRKRNGDIRSLGYAKNRNNDVSVGSNSFAQASDDYDDYKMGGVKAKVRSMPWNCSTFCRSEEKSTHSKVGKDCALRGSSLSRRRSKKAMSTFRKGEISDKLSLSETLSSSAMSNSLEALPLLLYSTDSQMDSNFTSEGKSSNKGAHSNFTVKYSPRTFDGLIGQTLVAQSLSNAVSKGKIGSIYVFYGPQGTGKTSCARIFARALTCRSRAGPKPCELCNSCLGRTHDVREIGRLGENLELKSIVRRLFSSDDQPRRKVFIFDECDALTIRDQWTALVRAVDRSPSHVVFVLVCSSLNLLPRVIVSKSHKFFFPKIKNGDIVRVLRFVAAKEGVEIEEEAVELIGSISSGSLRDAEMTLEQLSLLGRKITPKLVRELAGLALDEDLIDLLGVALSADSAKTVKRLREMGKSGVEPLALTSQLAGVITDILAGKFDVFINGRRRKFFGRQVLTKGDMEKLRMALKALSEAEKRMRVSNDKMTWLTIALLQIASDVKYDSGAINEFAYRGDKSTEMKSGNGEIFEQVSSGRISFGDVRKLDDEREDRNLGLVRAKVPLAQVIRLVEGYSRNGLWSSLRSVSVAEKLGKDKGLRSRSRSRSLLCWKNPRRTNRKHSSRLKMSRRRPAMFLRLVSCGRCPSV